MAAFSDKEITPSSEEIKKVLQAKLSYEAAMKKPKPEREAWTKAHFVRTPWGLSYTVCAAAYNKSFATAQARNWKLPKPKTDVALRYLIIAIAIDWQELVDQLQRTIKAWKVPKQDLLDYSAFWKSAGFLSQFGASLTAAQTNKIELIEAFEKHKELNTKLFTKEHLLQNKVRKKMLEIVDEFLNDLKEQDIEIKVDDILLIGSNASYNYTKNSDIDLHILANTKNINYSADTAKALYSAYRSLFNKNLDIEFFDIPVEIFVETEDSARMSNGIYSVKKDKWLKKPVEEDIPEIDSKKLESLVSEWEERYKKLEDEIKKDKLDDETKVVKFLEQIYEKLRKTGIAKSEYAIENLAFKELRNKGYLDKLKNYKNELISKRLSLNENFLTSLALKQIKSKISDIAGSTPLVQENGMFYLYNLKESDLPRIIKELGQLTDYIEQVHTKDSGNYDYSKIGQVYRAGIPPKYYDLCGKIKLVSCN